MTRRAKPTRFHSIVLLTVLSLALAGCENDNTASNPPAPTGNTVTEAPKKQSEAVQGDEQAADGIPYQQEVLASGLNVPWELVFAEDGRIFFTERPGQIRVIVNGELLEEPVLTMPEPFVSSGEGGLLGLVLDPDFSSNHYMYVYHTYEEKGAIMNRVLRLVEKNNQAEIESVLIDGFVGEQNHNGGRMKLGPDGHLYITVGDKYEPLLAQDKNILGGKILRISLDGTIPADNPIPNSPVYSYGHRNPQGLAWHPESGELYSSEHGQTAHDEVNRIIAGGNYGWPYIEGDQSGSDETEDKLITPLIHSGEETWAPSGMTFITSGPWKNQLVIANLRGSQLLKLTLGEDGSTVTDVLALFKDEWGRLRNVVEGPDGSLYILTNNRDGRGVPGDDDDRIIRLIPNWKR